MNLAVEYRKTICLEDSDQFISIADKYKQIQERGESLLSRINSVLDDFKKNAFKVWSGELKKNKQIWEKDFNEKLINHKDKCNFKLKYKEIDFFDHSKIKKEEEKTRNFTKKSKKVPEIKIEETSNELKKYYWNIIKTYSQELKPESLKFLVSKILENQKYKFNFLYRLSKRKKKYQVKKFLEKIEGKKNILTICISNTDHEFGGFAAEGWETLYDFTQNFIFSLDKGTIHPQIKNVSETATLVNSKGFGPCFGINDLKICNNCCNHEDSSTNLGEFFEFEGDDPKLYLAGSESFILKECLIFEIENFKK